MKETTKLGLIMTGISIAVLSCISYAATRANGIEEPTAAALIGMVAAAGIFVGINLTIKGDK